MEDKYFNAVIFIKKNYSVSKIQRSIFTIIHDKYITLQQDQVRKTSHFQPGLVVELVRTSDFPFEPKPGKLEDRDSNPR